MVAKRAVIAGASGFIGRALVDSLVASGWDVTKLVRRSAGDGEVQWNPGEPLDPVVVAGANAVINLAGASIATMPWSATTKAEILRSRIATTDTLVEAINAAKRKPKVFISGSAIGIYGDRGDEELVETSTRGLGFLADVVDQWEARAMRATIRTVRIRTGLVLGDGGALKPLRLATSLFAGARVGSGQQWWPWVSLHDEVRAIRFCIDKPVEGRVNVVGPTPATSETVTRSLARAMGRPHLFVIPRWLIGILGEAGHNLLLSSSKVRPEALEAAGFTFDHPTVNDAIDWVISGTRP